MIVNLMKVKTCNQENNIINVSAKDIENHLKIIDEIASN